MSSKKAAGGRGICNQSMRQRLSRYRVCRCVRAWPQIRGESIMLRVFAISAVSTVALLFSAPAFAQASGTAAEAKAMLDKAVVAVKADKAKAIEMFLKGEGGFKDRDLY